VSKRHLRVMTLAVSLGLFVAVPGSASAAVPPAPTNVHTSNITTSSILLSWSVAPGATSYRVYLGTFKGSTTSTSFNFTQLTPCKGYTMGVRSHNASGSSVWVKVSATTGGCSGPPPAPTNTSPPTISGTPQVGQTLTTTAGSWGNSPTSYTYQWQGCTTAGCTKITGATAQSYTATSTDVGHTLDVVVSAANAGGTGTAASAQTLSVTPAPSPPPPPPSSNGLHVSGAQLLDANGSVVRLHGVDYSGTEYACIQGYGIFDGSTPTQSYVNNLLAAHVNEVRIPLNEDCWLGVNGVSAAYGGSNYQTAIDNWASLLIQNGITPILDLHWSAPGSQQATGQQPMPDSDHSIAFWQSVATRFAGRNQIIFDLYNEPYPSSWTCWRDGGSACNGVVSFPVAGMQSLVNAVRNAGATNVIMLGCLDYANTCNGYNGTWTQYRPTDSANNLVASVHIYKGNACITAACWTSEYLPILQAGNPVIAGEWGAYDYNGANYDQTFGTSLLDWFDNNHTSGYTAWTWNNWNTWSTGAAEPLVQADDGSVLSTWGQFMSSQYAQRFP
jgi:endoglucanase